jgi:protein-L-isoaspartate O-methyltransferase
MTNLSKEPLVNESLDIFINHLLVRGIKDEKIVELLLKYPRKYFLPKELEGISISDGVVYYDKDSFLLDMASIGMMLSLLQNHNFSSCAVVGSKIGYLSCILSNYFDNVNAIESNLDMLNKSSKILENLEVKNVSFANQSYDKVSLSTLQDAIFIEGAFEEINPSWLANLKINGFIIGYKRLRNISKLVKIIKLSNDEVRIIEGSASAVPLLNGLNNREKFIF